MAPAFELDEPPQAPRNNGAQISKVRVIFFTGRSRHLEMNSLVFIKTSKFDSPESKSSICRKATDFEGLEISIIGCFP
jgi:hypothetical protein